MKIRIDRLPEGSSQLETSCEPEWLSLGEDDVDLCGPVLASLDIWKSTSQLIIRGEVKAAVRTDCSRCLAATEYPLCGSLEIVCQRIQGRSPERYAELDEPREIEYDATDLDIGADIREALLLELPLQPLCGDSCLGLCPICGRNLSEGSCGCFRKDVDPRWEALRRLASGEEEQSEGSENT